MIYSCHLTFDDINRCSHIIDTTDYRKLSQHLRFIKVQFIQLSLKPFQLTLPSNVFIKFNTVIPFCKSIASTRFFSKIQFELSIFFKQVCSIYKDKLIQFKLNTQSFLFGKIPFGKIPN